MNHDIEIITDRLILRHPVMADAEEINRAKNHVWEELQRWMVWAYDGQQTMEGTQEFIRTLGPESLIGLCRDTGKFVVSTGLMRTDQPHEYSTGYWVAEDFLGKGYATEATCAAIHFAFDALKAKAVHIGYLEGNAKSRRIIEKFGFSHRKSKTKSFARCFDGAMVDEHEFVMTDKSSLPSINYEWRGRW